MKNPTSIAKYKPLYMTRPTKTPTDTMTVSSCCGADPTELCNEDTGFCPDCRDHTEFVEVCVECNEQECLCPESTWKCLYCGSISHDDNISPKDGVCFFRPNGLVGNHTFRKVETDTGEHFDRTAKTDRGIIQI